MTDTRPLLEVKEVSKRFNIRGEKGTVTAVNNVSFTVQRGTTVALVGESGSGKSTLARIALRLLEPDSGSVFLNGVDLTLLRGRHLRRARIAMQPVFQDPAASLNPRRTVFQTLEQALSAVPSSDRKSIAIDLLDKVGLQPGGSFLARYPHEISGGQRQRLAIARALAMKPSVIIADEPLSGADVSVRGQLLNLLRDLQRSENVGYLMITHDISIARAFSDWVLVMHNGIVVEQGDPDEVLRNPRHDYTERLISSVPDLDGAIPVPHFPTEPRSRSEGAHRD